MKVYANPPTSCDFCKAAIETVFIDGKTLYGAWANMCEPCFRAHGMGLGTGVGQKYELRNGMFVKVAG